MDQIPDTLNTKIAETSDGIGDSPSLESRIALTTK
jgi:hypothetical protein